MGRLVNIDGKLYPPEEAKVSVFDHGFLFGDSIYETMRTYSGRIFLLDPHMERLENSARMMRLRLPLSRTEMKQELVRTVEAASNQESYVRLIVTRGPGQIGLDADLSKRAGYVIIVHLFEPPPAELYQNGIKLALVATRRNDRSALNPRMKSSNLLNNILAYMEAKEQGAFEGVLCNLAGFVTEGTGSNVFLVRDGVLLTPAPEAGLLEGITRALVLQLAEQERIPFAERNILPKEMLEADECFITGTTKAILPVKTIQERELLPVPGVVTARLMRAYDRFVEKGA